MEIKKTSKKDIAHCGNVVISGNSLEYIQYSNLGHELKWRKISKDLYVNIETGEYVKKVISDNGLKKFKTSNISSVKRSIKYIRRVINCNFFGDLNERFITLTYADNMQDVNILYKDFDKFIKRLKYFLEDNNLKYINIVEPQGRGAWHCHLLIKSNRVSYLSDEIILDKWGKGIIYQSSLDNVDNVGAYLSAYLTNTKDKKGARLYMYPQNMRIMRCSRNCKRPDIIKNINKYEFKKKFKNLKLKYIDSYQIINNGDVINNVCYSSYEVV